MKTLFISLWACFTIIACTQLQAQGKPVLVVFPIEVKQQDQEFASEFGSALQQGLAERYKVFYGPAVEKELQKEYEKLDCTAEQCRQNVAIAFNGELIGQASAKRLGNGYVLKLEVHNVFTGEIVESNTQPCRGCDGFAVIDGLKALGRNTATSNTNNNVVLNPSQNQSNNTQPTNLPAIVIFDSNPSSAKVTINGKDAGLTPYQGLQHTIGEQLTVELSQTNYQPLSFTLDVNKELIRISEAFTLQKGQGSATFALEPYQAGATLWLNKQSYGELPQVLQLPAGQYKAQAKLGSKVLASQDLSVSHQSQQTVRLQGATAPAPIVRSSSSPAVGESFKDCSTCPEMVVVPAGRFKMGGRESFEKPVHRVTLSSAFAVGKYEVTFVEWYVCVAAGGCTRKPTKPSDDDLNRPVIDVSWDDAQQYAKWLSQKTGKRYRLLSEAEWEYAARAGSTRNYSWGNSIGRNKANCRSDCGDSYSETAPVGSFQANAFGLYDMHGNVREWVQDCWNWNYRGAPADGRARMAGDCSRAVVRGGSFYGEQVNLRSGKRAKSIRTFRLAGNGFRLAQDL